MIDTRPDPEALLRLPGPLVGGLRRAATVARYDAKLLARAEAVAGGQLDAVRLPLVHVWLRALGDPAATWARLFGYRDAVEPERVRDALGEELARALGELGVLRDDGHGLRSSLRLMPFADLLVASDDADGRFDPVMGPGATTIELWRATAVPTGARVLDVGCGAGSLGLAAARHGAGEVVGVDLDPRAVAYARFNARLNELPNTRFEVGDLLAPVAGETFDLVLSQPPFVMQPPSVQATTYLHGGSRGDELALRLLAELPAVLRPGARALVLFDLPLQGGERAPAIERVRGALGSVPLQAIAITGAGLGPDQQALGYAAATHGDLGVEYADTARRYREHLRALEIDASLHVLLELRKPGAGEAAFMATVEPRGRLYDAAALAEVRSGLVLAARDAADLLDARVRPSPSAWLVQERSLHDRERTRFRVAFEGGRARDQELSEAAIVLVELFATNKPVRDVVDAYARACDCTPSEVQAPVLDFVRDALVSGLLVAAEA